MKAALQLISVFCAHVAFLFGSYGSGVFKLITVPYLSIVIWLGISSLVTAYTYFCVFERLSKNYASVFYTVVATCASLYLGVFFAFNTFGI